jgi:hypothetical protein
MYKGGHLDMYMSQAMHLSIIFSVKTSQILTNFIEKSVNIHNFKLMFLEPSWNIFSYCAFQILDVDIFFI